MSWRNRDFTAESRHEQKELEFDQFEIFIRSKGVKEEKLSRDELDQILIEIESNASDSPPGEHQELRDKIKQLRSEFDALSNEERGKINPRTGKIDP